MSPWDRIRHHMEEYQQWQNSQRRELGREDYEMTLGGYLHTMGFHPWHHPVIDDDEEIIRFPFLDHYYPDAGVPYLTFKEFSTFNVRRFETQLWRAFAGAYHRNELEQLITKERAYDASAAIAWGSR